MTKRTFVAIDIETTGLHPKPWDKNCKIFCISVNTGKTLKLYEPKDFKQLFPLLSDPHITKVIHNAKFDMLWIKRLYNIDIRSVWDTRLMEQIILGDNLPRSEKDENIREQLSSSLKYTLARYGLAKLDKTIGATFANRPVDKPLTKEEKDYAIDDVRYLLQLQAMQEYRLAKLDLMRVAHLENKLVEVVVSMVARGIGFDKNVWLDIARQNLSEYNSIIKRLPAQVNNWNSHQQVKKYFQSVGIPLTTLQELDELTPVYNNKALHLLAQARNVYQSTTTFGAKWLDDEEKGSTVDPDNRVRADFEQILNTGRFSCSHPNLQQIPRDGQHRAAFVPAKGYVFIDGDFSSQEIGIAAAASKEETWIKATLRGEDVHSLTASMVFQDEWVKGYEKGCTFPKKCKCKEHIKLREYAKVTNFTIIYGGGPGNISKKTKMSMKDAQKLVYKFKRSVPKLARWLGQNGDTATRDRISYSADPFKRRRTLRDPEDWMLSNIGKNNPIQSCGANMVKLSMISLPEPFNTPVLTLHDQLVIEVKKSQANKALKVLKGVMEKSADYCTGIPGLIKVEPRIAMNLLKQ